MVKLWNTKSLKQIKTFRGHTRSVLSVSIECKGKYIASGSLDFLIMIWGINCGKRLRSLIGHEIFINCV